MYTLIRSMQFRRLALQQGSTLAVSVLVAELFYKFHSFTLECVAFLATWYVADAATTFLADKRRMPSPNE